MSCLPTSRPASTARSSSAARSRHPETQLKGPPEKCVRLSDSWVWDFWLADTGERVPPVLPAGLARPRRPAPAPLAGDRRARGLDRPHDWTELADALVHSDGPAFDDIATWTGSVLQAPHGTWRMFYTGLSRTEGGRVQRIGSATSTT